MRIFYLTFLALTLIFVPFTARADYPAPVISPWSNAYERISNNNAAASKPAAKTWDRETERITVREAETSARNANISGPLPVRFQPSERERKLSALEHVYSERIVDELEQFGYDMFGHPGAESLQRTNQSAGRNENGNENQSTLMPMGAVQDDFILSHGDELEITFTGQRSDRGRYLINSQGQILIEDFPPIPAAGRSIGQVRLSIEGSAHSLHNTQAFVSLAQVRQIGVLIVGHVKRPGRQTLTVFHTALDALMEAGGVEKTGSLRQIKLVRHGRSTIIDLYALLMHGSTNVDLNLRDGDRIIVPPIGPTVAISGEVKRPGIYELLPALSGMHHQPDLKAQKLSLNEMLELGGGVLAAGDNRFLKMEISPEGQELISKVEDPFAPGFGDSAILQISKGREKRAGQIEIAGHTRKPGLHALADNKTLRALISSEDILGPDIYPLIGVIERWNPDQLTHTLEDFPPRLVLKGEYDRQLQDGDVVHLFSNAQIRTLGNSRETGPDEQNAPEEELGSQPDRDGDENSITDPDIASYLRERASFVRGAVRTPGHYPVSAGATLDSLISVAGGLTLEASTNNIEVTSALHGQGDQSDGRSGTQRKRINFMETSPGNVYIEAGDSVRINQKFKKIADNSVLIMGEIANPGRYDLMPGDKISDLLERAGGPTRQAYTEGAIFSRESERKAEEARFRAQARTLKQAIAAALELDDEKVGPAKIAEARSLAHELEEAQGIGRITVEADPAALAVQPELDLLLEPGDRVYIPRRNLTVRVSGEVLSPASLQFRESKKSLEYIHEAGGFTYHADKDRAFVLYPDGSAQPLQVSSWNYNPAMIPPGSTIVVPRDPKPFDFIESAKDISQILSNLVITSIFIDDVRDD